MSDTDAPEYGPQYGHFPAGDPGRQLETLPFARLIGIQWEGWSDAGVKMRLPWSTQVSQPDRPALDAGALLALIDQTCSAAGFRALRQPRLIATVDLRVEFATAIADRSDAICDAHAEWLDEDWAFIRARCHCRRTGALIALGSSTYALGTHPGGSVRQQLTPVLVDAWRNASRVEGHPASLNALMDLQRHDRGAEVPFKRSLVGAITLPAWHGGAIAAAMAGVARLSTTGPMDERTLLVFSIEYLRAARAQALELAVDVVKAGTRIGICEVTASQGDSRIARAVCTFRRAAANASRQGNPT